MRMMVDMKMFNASYVQKEMEILDKKERDFDARIHSGNRHDRRKVCWLVGVCQLTNFPLVNMIIFTERSSPSDIIVVVFTLYALSSFSLVELKL